MIGTGSGDPPAPFPAARGVDLDALLDHRGCLSVYVGFERGPSRDVALLVDDRPLDQDALARWRHVCNALPALRPHDHVLTVHAAGTLDDGRPYVVVPPLAEGTLADRVEQFGALPLGAVLDAGLQLVRGLGALHASGLAHGSVSPYGAVVVDEDRVALAPPAFAALARAAALRATGDPGDDPDARYASPQVLAGALPGVLDDVYALGATLHVLLAGVVPAPGEPLPRLSDVPRPVVSLLDRALDPDPAARPGSAAEFEADLAACAPLVDYAERKRWSGRYRGVAQHAPVPPVSRDVAAVAASGPEPVAAQPVPSPTPVDARTVPVDARTVPVDARIARARRSGVIALVLVLLVLAAALLVRRGEPPGAGAQASAPAPSAEASIAVLPAPTDDAGPSSDTSSADGPVTGALCVAATSNRIQDGSEVPARQFVPQTWELRNCGTQAWEGQGWQLVRSAGTLDPAAQGLTLESTIDPGEVLEVASTLLTPSTPGPATVVYQLVAPDGQVATGELRLSVVVVP